MEKQEMLVLSRRDRDRLEILHKAAKGHLTQLQAGAQLKLSARWVRKLVPQLRQEGDGGILHRRWGRASKRRIPEAVRRKAVQLVEREYRDFGPTADQPNTLFISQRTGDGLATWARRHCNHKLTAR